LVFIYQLTPSTTPSISFDRSKAHSGSWAAESVRRPAHILLKQVMSH